MLELVLDECKMDPNPAENGPDLQFTQHKSYSKGTERGNRRQKSNQTKALFDVIKLEN